MFFKKKKKIPKYTFYNPKEITVSEYEERHIVATEAFEDLKRLIGLESVKDQISKQYAKLQTDLMRKDKHIKTKNNRVLHMCFLGNPGTGKTECARIVGKIYYGLGVLPTDTFVEVSRAELVGDNIMSSSQKVDNIIQKSLGGILFIDEAYSVCYGSHDLYGKEAVDALIKQMEDKKDDFAVIMAGYTKEMQDFLQLNPGFESRIPNDNKIMFENYTEDELLRIFKYMVQKDGYILSSDITGRTILRHLKEEVKNGNARDVRNYIDALKSRTDISLVNKARMGNTITEEELITIPFDVL